MIVGLGNPGPAYKNHRHNLGLFFEGELARQEGVKPTIKHKNILGGMWKEAVFLIRPLTYMNDSGRAIGPYAKKKSVSPENILVMHDELDFPLGKLRFKFGGSEGGHNGLISMSNHLQTRNYWRLRIGIGRPANKADVTKYVLTAPPPEERNVYVDLADKILSILEEFVFGNRENAIRILSEL